MTNRERSSNFAFAFAFAFTFAARGGDSADAEGGTALFAAARSPASAKCCATHTKRSGRRTRHPMWRLTVRNRLAAADLPVKILTSERIPSKNRALRTVFSVPIYREVVMTRKTQQLGRIFLIAALGLGAPGLFPGSSAEHGTPTS